MSKQIDLQGKKFTRLTALRYLGKTKWECICECGNKKDIAANSLLQGHSMSCGCLQKERASQSNFLHGMKKHPFYTRWKAMRQRCNDVNCSSYKNYGGRGIIICGEWNEFSKFKEDMWETFLTHYDKHGGLNTTLSRIDNDGIYCKENCRWETRSEQNQNTRNCNFQIYNGEKLNLKQLARKVGIPYTKLQSRLWKGKSLEEAIAV